MQESLLQRDAFRLRWKDEREAAVLRAQDKCSTYKKEQTPRSSARLVMAMDRLRPDSAEETQSRPAIPCNAKWLLVILRVTLSESSVWII